jgi:hypothetical protein
MKSGSVEAFQVFVAGRLIPAAEDLPDALAADRGDYAGVRDIPQRA